MLLMLGVAALAMASTADGAGSAAPAVDLQQAQALLARQDCKGAVKAFRKAEKTAPAPPFELLIGAANAFNCLKAYQDAEDYARRALAAAGDPVQEVEAYNRLGQSLFAGGSASADRLEQAAESFRQAHEVSQGRLKIARYNLGQTLLKLERDEEGVADHQGVILYRTSGWSPRIEMEISGQVSRATKELKRAGGS
jgi:tetratricopeptide (TPR) repeat protein